MRNLEIVMILNRGVFPCSCEFVSHGMAGRHRDLNATHSVCVSDIVSCVHLGKKPEVVVG